MVLHFEIGHIVLKSFEHQVTNTTQRFLAVAVCDQHMLHVRSNIERDSSLSALIPKSTFVTTFSKGAEKVSKHEKTI